MNGNETCAAPAAAHVFGQCRACSCSHHIVSGQPLVPSRLSHLAVHGTINRTISRCWGDELWCSMMNSVRQGYDPSQLDYTSLTLSCLYANSIVQTKLEVNLYLALIERQREGLVHVVAHVWIQTYEGTRFLLTDTTFDLILLQSFFMSVPMAYFWYGYRPLHSIEPQYGWNSKLLYQSHRWHKFLSTSHTGEQLSFEVFAYLLVGGFQFLFVLIGDTEWHRMTQRQDPSTRTLWPFALYSCRFPW